MISSSREAPARRQSPRCDAGSPGPNGGPGLRPVDLRRTPWRLLMLRHEVDLSPLAAASSLGPLRKIYDNIPWARAELQLTPDLEFVCSSPFSIGRGKRDLLHESMCGCQRLRVVKLESFVPILLDV